MQRRQRTAFIALFLAPSLALYLIFVVWPVAQAFLFSLYRWRGVSENRTFAGLENFHRLATDPIFFRALWHNVELLAFGGSAILLIAMGLAHALRGGGRMARSLRAVYLIPQVISLAAVAILWMFVFNPSFGLLTGAMKAVGLGRYVLTWLGDPRSALACVAVVFVWQALGFYIMLFGAGLQTIPAEVYEAATLDGATGLVRFGRVTFPLLWSLLRVAIVYLVITTVNVFALVFLMTNGGPDRHTEVMLTYLYEQAFTNSDFGYATALAVANFIIVMGLSGFVLAVLRRDPTEGRR